MGETNMLRRCVLASALHRQAAVTQRISHMDEVLP